MADVEMRIKPSGTVHRFVSRKKIGASILIYVHKAACGRQVSDRRVTTDFPADCRRCSTCFPEVDGGS